MEENTAIELVQVDGEVLVDSRTIAKGVGVRHQTIMETIYTYQSELEEFGVLRFETERGERSQGGGTAFKYAKLNRNQAGIVISFSRNTKTVVRFKVDLFHRIDAMEQIILHQQQELAGQQRPPAQLPPPLFEEKVNILKAAPLCPCPTRSEVETAILGMVEILQIAGQHATLPVLLSHNKECHAYLRTHGPDQMEGVLASLVKRRMLTVEDDFYYHLVSTAGQIEGPQQGE